MEKLEIIEINGTEYRIDGDSAYETAVKKGFKGTEEEWLDAIKTKKPKIGNVTLLASKWESVDPAYPAYSQAVSIDDVTKNTQVDLTPSIEQLVIFYEKDLAFVAENAEGDVTVYVIGQKPKNDYEMQVTMTEVQNASKKIIGVTVGTPISPSKIEEKINPIKTINNVAPDENGNVQLNVDDFMEQAEDFTYGG